MASRKRGEMFKERVGSGLAREWGQGPLFMSLSSAQKLQLLQGKEVCILQSNSTLTSQNRLPALLSIKTGFPQNKPKSQK